MRLLLVVVAFMIGGAVAFGWAVQQRHKDARAALAGPLLGAATGASGTKEEEAKYEFHLRWLDRELKAARAGELPRGNLLIDEHNCEDARRNQDRVGAARALAARCDKDLAELRSLAK